MLLTANLFRGNRTKTLEVVETVIEHILQLIQNNQLCSKTDHLIATTFTVDPTHDTLNWRLHIMATLMQLMNIVLVLTTQ